MVSLEPEILDKEYIRPFNGSPEHDAVFSSELARVLFLGMGAAMKFEVAATLRGRRRP